MGDGALLLGVKVRLRDWRVEDLGALAYWLQPGRRWQELDGPYYPHPSVAEIPDIVAQRRMAIESGQLSVPRTSLVVTGAEEDTLLGCVTWYWESQETNWLSVGIVLYDEACWGKGLGYEALGLWGDYMFTTMPELARLDLRTWSGNTGMMRLAEKLGYREEARFRKARIVGGLYYDGMGYGVLREEWQQLYPDGFAASLARPPK